MTQITILLILQTQAQIYNLNLKFQMNMLTKVDNVPIWIQSTGKQSTLYNHFRIPLGGQYTEKYDKIFNFKPVVPHKGELTFCLKCLSNHSSIL